MATPKDKLVYRLRFKFRLWVVLQVLVPAASVAFLWPVHRLFHRPFGFERTFSGAELLLVGCLLLFGAMIDIQYEQRTEGRPETAEPLDIYYLLNFFFGFVLLIVYITLKIYMMLYEFPDATISPTALEAGICATASLVGVIAGAGWAGLSTHVAYKLLAGQAAAGVSP